jgi:N-acetylated-alpha-linked acidic dipeptidase
LRQTATDLPHPTRANATLWDATKDNGPFTESALNGFIDPDFQIEYEKQQAQKSKLSTGVHPMGSGSDFTVFLQRLGVASSDQSFTVTPTDAPYHSPSIYDTHSWQVRYADPGFKRHVSVSSFLLVVSLFLMHV